MNTVNLKLFVLQAIMILSLSIPLKSQDNGIFNNFWKPVEGKRYRFSSWDTTGLNKDYVIIRKGQGHVLCDLKKTSGCIQRIWFTISSQDTLYLQKFAVRMTFDNEVTVDNVPVGMLTGTGPWRVNDISSPLINIMRSKRLNNVQSGVGAGSFNINFPMPFTSNAKIEMINNTAADLILYFHVEFLEIKHDKVPLLFHADYNIQSPTIPAHTNKTLDTKSNYRLLKKDNYQGRYAGTILCVESHPDREGKWYEGDDMFIIDNEPWPPRLHGTGTEDYFGMAWGLHRPYQGFDHGVSHFEKNITDHDRFYDGRYVIYRFHINDPIVFNRNIDVSIEAGNLNDCAQHYESVVFWYGRKIK